MSNSKQKSAAKSKKPTQLILVRHGQSNWNAEQRLAGQSDVALSPAGCAQVTALRATVESFAPATITCSDLQRTRATAALLGFATPQLDPRLRECHLGDWEGKTIATLPPAHYRRWRAGRFTPPQGEEWPRFCDRVEAALNDLMAQEGIHLIVTHGGVVRAACHRLLKLRPDRIVPVGPASLTVFDISFDIGFNRGAHPRLLFYNMAAGQPVEGLV